MGGFYRTYPSVSISFLWLGPPIPQSSVHFVPLPPPGTKGGTHSPAGVGVDGSQFGRMEKEPSAVSTLPNVDKFLINTAQ